MRLPGYDQPGGATAWWCILLCGIPFLLALIDIIFLGGDTFSGNIGIVVEVLALVAFVMAPILAIASIVQVRSAHASFTFLHVVPVLIVVLLVAFFVIAATSFLGP